MVEFGFGDERCLGRTGIERKTCGWPIVHFSVVLRHGSPSHVQQEGVFFY